MYDAIQTRRADASLPVAAPLIVPAVLLLAFGLALVLGATGQYGLLRLYYPWAALVLGAFLYVVHPATYIEFVWYLWFFSPFVRRFIDYQAGWMNPNPVLLAPFLATGVCVLGLLRNLGRLRIGVSFFYGLVLLSIIYGYTVGLVRNSLFVATFSLLEWVVPVLFSLFLVQTWTQYPAYRTRLKRVFRIGVFLMGVYALVQFFFLPAWDAYWIVNAELDSVGEPKPFLVRIFSTMNSPAPFGHAMMAGLLLVFSELSVGTVMAVIPGLVAFLLSLSRQSWGGWLLGLLVVVTKAEGRFRSRLVRVLVVSSLFALPLLATDAIYSRISARFETLSNLEEDNSLAARMAAYRGVSLRILKDPVGSGIGATGAAQKAAGAQQGGNLDSGFLDIPFALGWLGGFLYLFGMVRLLLHVARSRVLADDHFALVAFGISVGMFAMLAFGKVQSDVSGMVLWTFLGMAVAAVRYHRARIEQAQASDEHPLPDLETA